MKKFIIIPITLLLISVSLSGQKAANVDLKQLDTHFTKMVNDWGVPAMSVGIVKDGQLIFTGNYGVLEEGKSQKPDEHSLYAIASNSKAFTSAMIGMLVQEGKLNWEDKVQDYLPYFELYDPWVSSQVTVKDLLCHRVGLGTFSGDIIWYLSDLSSEEIIKRARHIPQAYEFRAGYGYSNVMYITAGELIRTITGKTWTENVKERILKPLGMSRTTTSLREVSSLGNFAMPHAREGDRNRPIDHVDWEEIAATGGLISSVSDIAKWMIFNLDHGTWEGKQLLSPATRNRVWTPHNNRFVDHTTGNDFNRHFNAYGLGWGLSDYHGRLRVGHTGGYDGMLTAVTLIPDENLGVVVLTNGMKSPYMAATYHALDQYLGIKGKDWSKDLLERSEMRKVQDTRVSDRRKIRKLNTLPLLDLEAYTGTYHTDMRGDIIVSLKDKQLNLTFEHSPGLSARLRHWHYDVWEIVWEKKHAWFDFGTVRFVTDNNLEVTGLEFDVPNDDFFFEELKPYKVD